MELSGLSGPRVTCMMLPSVSSPWGELGMRKRVIGFIVVSAAIVLALVGLASAEGSTRLGVSSWLRNADVFPVHRQLDCSAGSDDRLHWKCWDSRLRPADQTIMVFSIPALPYFLGLLIVALAGTGLVVFGTARTR